MAPCAEIPVLSKQSPRVSKVKSLCTREFAVVPELKGKTTAIKVVAITEWLKSISKHQISKGTALGEVVLTMAQSMSKLFDWPVEEIADKAWELAREDKGRFVTQDAGLLEKAKEGISGDRAIEDQDQKAGTLTAAAALLIKALVHRPHSVMAARIAAAHQSTWAIPRLPGLSGI